MKTRFLMAIAMMACTLIASAQETRIFANRGTAEAKLVLAPMIRAFKAQSATTPAVIQPAEANPCPSPIMPCEEPTGPGVTVTGIITDIDDAPITGAYVIVSFLNSSGSRENYSPVLTDSTGTFISRSGFTEPTMGTEMLVQATYYAQTPWESQYQVSSASVEVTGSLNNAGRIEVKHQMKDIWIEAFASGNTVAIRVRKGNLFPGRDIVSSIMVSTPARTAYYRTESRDQQPFMGRPISTGIVSRTWGWNYFSIPENAPKGGGMCGNVQVSSQRDPSVVHSSEHGFCYNPGVGVLGTW